MAENLFILGAGASADAGAPLMNGFFDRAYELHGEGGIRYSDSFREVFELLRELRLVYANSYLDLNNIESLFGAIEMGLIINLLGKRTDEEIIKVRKALVRLIVTTLEKSISYKTNEKQGILSTVSYGKFADLIKNKMSNSSIITFNYDIALDYALYTRQIRYSYCLQDEVHQNTKKMMKLHGSVNWAICNSCKAILPITFEQRYGYRIASPYFGDGATTIEFDELIQRQEHNQCKTTGISSCDSVPVIVPPTWNKKDYHGNLTNVWKQAAIELREASNIYVIGYSLPESDAFFRYLFALGSFDNPTIKRFWVYNPDESRETMGRYETLLGKGIHSRYQYKHMKFAEAIVDLSNSG